MLTDAQLAEIEAQWKDIHWIACEDWEVSAVDEIGPDGDWQSAHQIADITAFREDPHDELAPLMASAPDTIRVLLAELRRLRGIGETLAANLTGLDAERDVERWHDYADKLLCQALRDLGAEKAANIFAGHEKWYA